MILTVPLKAVNICILYAHTSNCQTLQWSMLQLDTNYSQLRKYFNSLIKLVVTRFMFWAREGSMVGREKKKGKTSTDKDSNSQQRAIGSCFPFPKVRYRILSA